MTFNSVLNYTLLFVLNEISMFYYATWSYCVLYFRNKHWKYGILFRAWVETSNVVCDAEKIAIEPTLLRHSRQRYIPRCQYGPSSYTDGAHSWISPDSRHRCAIDVCQIFKHDIVCYCLDIYENCFLVSTQTHLENRLLLRSCQNKQLANANILLYVSTVAWQEKCYPYPIPDLTGWNSDRVELSGGSNSASRIWMIRVFGRFGVRKDAVTWSYSQWFGRLDRSLPGSGGQHWGCMSWGPVSKGYKVLSCASCSQISFERPKTEGCRYMFWMTSSIKVGVNMYLVMGILNAWRNIFCLTRCSSITIHCLNIAWRRLASHFFGFLSWVNLAEHDAVPNLDILGTPTVCGSMVAGGRTPTATTPTSRAPHFVWVLERFGLETWCETEGVGFSMST